MIGLVLVGALSFYAPNDGHNAGALACGGRFNSQQNHIAIRNWRGRCGAVAAVYSAHSGKWALTTVRDSGPWGAVNGRKWEVQIKLKKGWKRRGVVDLSVALWRKLGKPPFRSPVLVILSR